MGHEVAARVSVSCGHPPVVGENQEAEGEADESEVEGPGGRGVGGAAGLVPQSVLGSAAGSKAAELHRWIVVPP